MVVEMLEEGLFRSEGGTRVLKKISKKDEGVSCFDSSYAGSVR